MKSRKKRGYDSNVYQSFSLIVQFGLYMLVPIGGMTVLGYFLDKKLGTNWIFILCFFIGAIAGAQNVYRLAMKIARKPRQEEELNVLNAPKGGEQDAGVAEEEK